MNSDETVAYNYLTAWQHHVQFEPDGNVPPDFVLDSHIAVEVRRLNQQHRNGVVTRGLEEEGIPFMKTIREVFLTYPRAQNDESYSVTVAFKRGIDNKRNIHKGVGAAIRSFEKNDERLSFEYEISANLTLRFLETVRGIPEPYKYYVDDEEDQDVGGWLFSFYPEDIRHCIVDKERKTEPYRERYSVWWLILVDHIRMATREDYNKISAHLNGPGTFDKLVIIDYLGKHKLLEL